jgi:hypothetical protein
VGTLRMSLQLTTLSCVSPLTRPTATSVDSPRMVVVMGAMVTRVRCGRTASRVRTRSGRVLSC